MDGGRVAGGKDTNGSSQDGIDLPNFQNLLLAVCAELWRNRDARFQASEPSIHYHVASFIFATTPPPRDLSCLCSNILLILHSRRDGNGNGYLLDLCRKRFEFNSIRHDLASLSLYPTKVAAEKTQHQGILGTPRVMR